MTQTDNADTYDLFMSTVDVFNRAIERHGDKPVIRQVVAGADKALSGQRLGVAVYKDDADTPFDYFTLAYNNGKFELASRGKDAPDIAWKVSQDYLKKVANNPEDYEKNPAKLDFDWIKSRAGFSVH
jgi:hypothetical protein